MAFGMNKTRLTPLAIDFGVDTVKVLQVSTGDESTQLIGAGAMVVPESARKDSAARYTFMADAVKELVRQQPFKGRRVMCAIPAFQTLSSTLELPCAENDDIDQQVSLHLQTEMEMDPSRMVIRNMRIGSVVRDGQTRQRVVCTAASRAVVMRYLELAAAAKLEVVGMHSEATCIAKVFSELYSNRAEDKTESRCFVDFGAASTKLVIAKDGKVLLARNIRVAGDALTQRHASEQKTDFAEARMMRIRSAVYSLDEHPHLPKSVRQTAGATATAVADDDDDDLDIDFSEEALSDRRGANTVEPAAAIDQGDDLLDTLIDEIRMTVRYHESVHPDAPVQRVVLLGGESHHRWIAETIAYAFGVPTCIGDPLARVMRTPGLVPVGVDMSQAQPGWAVPLGLCLSEANL